jgi:stage V sporulation protein R
MPEISVVRYAHDTDRKLVLQHQSYGGKMLLKAQAEQTLKHLRTLWGFDVSLETVDQSGRTLAAFH